jgi:hypothetical protein
MKKKNIKITENQLLELKNLLREHFDYFGNDTTSVNQNSKILVNQPYDATDIEINNTTGDDLSQELTNNSWWCRRFR